MFKILSWYENLPGHEIPPQWMWALDWEVEDWFLEIDRIRSGAMGAGVEDREEVDMTPNEFSPRFDG